MTRASAWAWMVTAACGCGFPKSGPAPGPLSPEAVSAATARWPETSEAQLQSGRDLFVAKCNQCHSYPDVTAIEDERWTEILSRMGKKAELDEGQTEAVRRFVRAARADLLKKKSGS